VRKFVLRERYLATAGAQELDAAAGRRAGDPRSASERS
jgi:hypothetical protein